MISAIALRIDHERDAHGFHCLVNPGVGEYVALVVRLRFAAQLLAGFHELSIPPGPSSGRCG